MPIQGLFFVLISVGCYIFADWLIKKNNAFRIFAFLSCLLIGGIQIYIGFYLLGTFLISPFIIMVSGGLLIIFGTIRSLLTKRTTILKEAAEDKIAEAKQKEEDANYKSYNWICQEARNILASGKIEDHDKFSRLVDVMDANRKNDELKFLSKELHALDDKEHADILGRLNRTSRKID
jgi:hypothetical protein